MPKTIAQLLDLHGNNLIPQGYTNAYIFPSVRGIDVEYHSYVITKACYTFGNLEVYSYINNTVDNIDGLWENIPKYIENDMRKELIQCKIPITGLVDKYISHFIIFILNGIIFIIVSIIQ